MSAPVVISFDCRDYSNLNGKIDVSCQITVGDSFTYDFYVGITSPLGDELKAFPLTADVVGLAHIPPNRESVLVDIPLDDDGNYLGGTYTFKIRIVNNSNSDDETWEVDYLFVSNVEDPSNLNGPLVVNASMNCLTGVLSAEDPNDYEELGLDFLLRSLKITPPTIDTANSEVDTTNATAEISPNFTNALYQVLLYSQFNWAEEELQAIVGTLGPVTAIGRGTLFVYKTVNVECEAGGVCGSLPCIQAEMDAAYTRACKAGGFSGLSQVEKDNLTWSVLNILVAKATYDCGQVAKSLTYVNRAKEGLDCSCGCDDTDDTAPVPYTPPTA